jgi:hypothetical protein
MEQWTDVQLVFAMKAFYKNGDSLRKFRREFGFHRNRAVPSAHAIKTSVRNFEVTGSTLKKKGGSVKTVRTPENILCHSGCLKPAFDGFYTKIFTYTTSKFKLLMHYMNVTM